MSWEESKYSLGDHSESHYVSIDMAINAIDLIPAGVSTSVNTDIYISSGDDSVYSSDPVEILDYFVTENPDTSFDSDKSLTEDFKIHRITSKYSDKTTASTTYELHTADTIREQLDTGTKVSFTNLKYILHNYIPYTSNFWCSL